jgi:HSP20 family molecular chaperone IbpA
MTTLTTYRPTLLGRNVFDDIFDSMLDIPALMNRTTQGYPVADIYKNDEGATIMEFALAGFQKENLHVNIIPEKGEVHISADSHGDEEQENFNSRRIARRAFHKTFVNYDSNLDLSKAKASYENGLLTTNLPARPEAETINVEIG